MTESRQHQVELANMAGIIERLAGDLALGEEPARFIAALEARGLGLDEDEDEHEDEVEAPRDE
jgi:hypothetical protein